VYSATYSGTGKTYKSTSTAEQRAVEAYNRKTTKERKLKAGAKRAKEEF
jgi:hypothetical protein